MPSGCDGSWKGRRLFSCPKMRGLFLPVASVLREKEFYDKKGSSSKPRYCYVAILEYWLIICISLLDNWAWCEKG